MNDFIGKHILLAVMLVLWCMLHSAMISVGAIELSKKILKNRVKYYRLFYNSVAVITLLPILALNYSMPKLSCFGWNGYFRIFQILLLGLGLFLLFAGARGYDGLQFLGIRQILSQKHRVGLSESGGLHIEGILNVTRHPWYVAGILVLWAREIDSASIIVNVIFSSYLVVGAMLEEKKLVREFAEDYADYQQKVSMFFPWKWIVSRFQRK